VAIQRDRHEAALRASEQRFRRCFQGAATGMAIATLEGRLVEVNQAYCDMLGYSEQELYGMDIQATTYARHWPLTQAQFLDLTEGRTACFVVENHCQAKSGELVWIRNSVSLLRGATGQPEGFIGIAEDTTRQRRAFDQLRLLETAVSRLNDIVMITEAEPINAPGPRIVFVNDAFERRTGYSREESLGQSPRFLQGPKTQRTEQDRIRAALLQFKPVRAELINYRKSGQAFWLELDIVPIADDTGWFTHWVGVGRDITERKQSQLDVLQLNADLEDRVRVRTVQLESANRELEAFSYSVSHDLRSPLNTVNGFGQLLQKSNADNLNDKGKHYLARIRAGTQQMGELIEGLLSLAKLSRNALRPERVDLTASAVRVDQECREREPDRQVGLRVQPDMVARGDATLLLLVMQNLVGNAWKYTSKQTDARIDVGSELSDSGETVYFVRDNGAGFDMAHADKLFGAFQRLHAPSDFAGNGVGLANVKRVVERHGGRVWAEGHLDSGATFFFTLACPDV
jgi:PAS domain S-box-containing protein